MQATAEVAAALALEPAPTPALTPFLPSHPACLHPSLPTTHSATLFRISMPTMREEGRTGARPTAHPTPTASTWVRRRVSGGWVVVVVWAQLTNVSRDRKHRLTGEGRPRVGGVALAYQKTPTHPRVHRSRTRRPLHPLHMARNSTQRAHRWTATVTTGQTGQAKEAQEWRARTQHGVPMHLDIRTLQPGSVRASPQHWGPLGCTQRGWHIDRIQGLSIQKWG